LFSGSNKLSIRPAQVKTPFGTAWPDLRSAAFRRRFNVYLHGYTEQPEGRAPQIEMPFAFFHFELHFINLNPCPMKFLT
jgi:hypothetical protein